MTALVLVGCWLLSGCSADNNEDDNNEDAEVDREKLHEYLFSPFGDSGQLDDLHRELDLLGESLVRDCMSEHGFEYVPFVPGDGSSTNMLSDEEYVEVYGFGYSTAFDQPDDSPDADGFDDPNSAILASLSAAEREAYRDAMYGDDGQNEDVGGCQAARFEASIPRLAVFEEFYGRSTNAATNP